MPKRRKPILTVPCICCGDQVEPIDCTQGDFKDSFLCGPCLRSHLASADLVKVAADLGEALSQLGDMDRDPILAELHRNLPVAV